MWPLRDRAMPRWLANETTARLAGINHFMVQQDLALYTRALARSPEEWIAKNPQGATFEWIVRPRGEGWLQGRIYTDGSLLDGLYKYSGFCKRIGWSFVVLDQEGTVIAAAQGSSALDARNFCRGSTLLQPLFHTCASTTLFLDTQKRAEFGVFF